MIIHAKWYSECSNKSLACCCCCRRYEQATEGRLSLSRKKEKQTWTSLEFVLNKMLREVFFCIDMITQWLIEKSHSLSLYFFDQISLLFLMLILSTLVFILHFKAKSTSSFSANVQCFFIPSSSFLSTAHLLAYTLVLLSASHSTYHRVIGYVMVLLFFSSNMIITSLSLSLSRSLSLMRSCFFLHTQLLH